MNDTVYSLPDNPSYHEQIRKIQNTDPVNAETIVNPLIEKMLENTQFVKNQQEAHTAQKDNPHAVTKNQIGLGNVDNTADINKPISTAMQNALNEKADNSHTHTAAQVGALAAGGTAAAATKLAAARTIRTNLASTSTASFDGTANVMPGVTGTLPIANGGTGATTAANALTKLGAAPSSHTHAATSITQDSSHRFVTDSEKSIWNTKSNPNLLDNWYFADPINQRGKETYTGSGTAIDRWNIHDRSDAASVAIHSGYTTVKLGNGSALDALVQAIEVPLTVGKTYTSSILTKEGTLLTVSKECLEYETYAAYNSELACGFVENHLNLIINHGSPAVSLNIIAMKFEEGLQQTLARQENGKWVLNDPPPNKALELLKCQRYYFRTDAEQYFPCSFFGVQGCCLLVPSPAPMRTTPSVNILKKGNVTIGSTSFSPSNVKNIITGMDASGIKLVFDFESNAPAQGVAVLTDWSFEFSADL